MTAVYFKVEMSNCALAYKDLHSLTTEKFSMASIFYSTILSFYYRNSGLLVLLKEYRHSLVYWAFHPPRALLPAGCIASSLTSFNTLMYSAFLMRSRLTMLFTVVISPSSIPPALSSSVFS